MGTQELTLNIAVNLDRVSRFSAEGRENRVDQFLNDTDFYVSELKGAPKNPQFINTYKIFIKEYAKLRSSQNRTDDWAEKALTWSNILTHRAKLA